MRPPEQPSVDKWFLVNRPFSPAVVLLELFRVSAQASTLYTSDDWKLVCEDLSDQSRTEVLKGLRATQAVVEAMAQSLETSYEDPNYGIQR